jgi:adenylylsulfate kinase
MEVVERGKAHPKDSGVAAMSKDSKKRSVLKTLSWRVIATSIGMGLIYFYTGEAAFSVAFGVADFVIKSAAYYLHERVWT